MMADLIPFAPRQLGIETVNTVNARDLYAYLELSGDYSLWIRRALKRANLVENVDFIVYYQAVENPKGGRPLSEHHLSFDAAKHVAMMSSATKGHEARQWFIEKEKELAVIKHGALERFPELRAIVELAQSTAEARLLAETAQAAALQATADAAQANANAHRALETQSFMTVAEYVYVNGLQAQLPQTSYKACSDALRLYCLDRNIPFRKIPVGGQRWEDEYGYHVSVYAEVLPGWLARRFAQPSLRVLRPDESGA
jgi:phage anti-repressor protein